MFLKYQKKDWHVVSTGLHQLLYTNKWALYESQPVTFSMKIVHIQYLIKVFMVTVDKVLFSPETVLVKLPCSETASRHMAEETNKCSLGVSKMNKIWY